MGSVLLPIDKLGRKGEQLMKTGFTLIELLVVVLIIGILAAIALPQYQKAVERSRMAEALQVLGDWANAQSIYYMQHNAFTEDINDGDISIPAPGGAFEYTPIVDSDAAMLVAQRSAGMYAGGLLTVQVETGGDILKGCQDPVEATGFCPMAEPAGYESTNLGGVQDIIHDCGYGEYWDGTGCVYTER